MSILSQKLRKQQQSAKGGRLLITVNVLGSAGPLRFLVNEEELVAAVIDTALRCYAREGRLPVLGSDLNNFLLYSANAESDALSPCEAIGARGGRNFLLYKNKQRQVEAGEGTARAVTVRKRNRSWKSWLNKSLTFKISTH